MNKQEVERITVIETQLAIHMVQNDKDNSRILKEIGKISDKFDNLDKKFAPKVTLYLATTAFIAALGIITSLIIM